MLLPHLGSQSVTNTLECLHFFSVKFKRLNCNRQHSTNALVVVTVWVGGVMLLNTKSIWLRNYTWRDKDKRTFKSRRITDLFEIECFHSRGQHLCKFIGTKESVCLRKEFKSHRTYLGHQHGRRFIVLEHQYGRRDVMWKHSQSFLESKLLNFAIIACVLKRFQSSFCAKVIAGNGRL